MAEMQVLFLNLFVFGFLCCFSVAAQLLRWRKSKEVAALSFEHPVSYACFPLLLAFLYSGKQNATHQVRQLRLYFSPAMVSS